MVKGKSKKTKVKRRPPRIFVNKKGQLYIQVGKKKFLIIDNEKKYSKSDILDILLKNLLVRRKRRKKGKITKREKKLNEADLAVFNEFEKLNRSKSKSKGLKLPAKPDHPSGFYNALVKFFQAAPEDVNITNRKSKKKTSTSSTALVPFSGSAPASSSSSPPPPSGSSSPPPSGSAPPSPSFPIFTPPVGVIEPKPKIVDLTGYEQFKDDVRLEMMKDGKRKLGNLLKEIIRENPDLSDIKVGRLPVEGMYDLIVERMETLDKRGELFLTFKKKFVSIENLERIRNATSTPPPPPPGGGPAAPGAPPSGSEPPAPLSEFSFKIDSEMKEKETREYENMKRATIAKFLDGQVVPKRILLQKLIADQKIPIEAERTKTIKSGPNKGKKQYVSTKGAEDLANELFEYFEKNDTRVKIPSIINTYFPEGINAVTAPVFVKPVIDEEEEKKKTASIMLDELRKKLDQKNTDAKDATGKKETIQERLDREKKEKEQVTALSFLSGIKLKPTSGSTKTDMADMADVPELEEADAADAKDDTAAARKPEASDAASQAASLVLSQIKQDADGIIYKGKGLNTNEIDDMMGSTGVKNYLGTFSSDFLKFLIPRLRSRKNPRVFSFIMNTDPSTKKGKHWIAVRVDTEKDNSIDYYDSFGRDPSSGFMKQIKKLIDIMKVNTYLKLKVNRIQDQNVKTSNCGFFCIKFLVDRSLSKNFKESTSFNPAGEKELKIWKDKMFSYI